MRSKHFSSALAVVCLCMSVGYNLWSQGPVSLLFGDELRSGQLGYGLNFGVNYSSMTGTDATKLLPNFYFGTYFDIRLREKSDWFLHTGFRIKSGMGARELGVYHMEEPNLDPVFEGGYLTRRLQYIHLHALVRYKFTKRFFVEAGPMFGLLIRAKDEFFNSMKRDNDLLFKNIVTEQYRRFDTGVEAGIGSHLFKGKGIDLGVRYYQGLIPVVKDKDAPSCLNQSFYLFVSLPLGGKEKAPPQ